MKRVLGFPALLLLALAGPAAAQTPPAVPFTMTTISGNGSATGPPVTYRAYQEPGQPFRILCQEPCAISSALIDAAYAGFKAVRPDILSFMGIDILPELQPYDLHLNGDSYCGPYNTSLTGDASTYPSWSGPKGVVSCFWDVEKLNRALPFTPENAVKREDQLLKVHEYCHGIFFGRHIYSYEDVVKAASFYVAGINGRFITDPCDAALADFSQGRLMYTLCRGSGFRFSDLAPTLVALNAIFQNGQGAATSTLGKPRTSVSQWKELLKTQTGRETAGAFLATGFTAAESGDRATLPKAGGRVTFVEGSVTLAVPAGAIAADTPVTLETSPSAPGGLPNFTFSYYLRLQPDALVFAQPARLSFRFEPFYLPAGTPQSNLRLYRVASNVWQEVPGAVVDVYNQSITAPIAGLGQFAIAAATGTPFDPAARAVPVVLSAPGLNGSLFKTQLQLHNIQSSGNAVGRLVFHPAGAGASASDPFVPYSLGFRNTTTLPDLFTSLGLPTGNGTLDVVATAGTAPGVVASVFNDAGAAGTLGFAEDAVAPDAALKNGERAVLLAPANIARERLNLGVRSLALGAAFGVTVRGPGGNVVKTLSKSYPPTFFAQAAAADFLGLALSGNESIEFVPTSGNAVLYAALADNTTNDPSLLTARRLRRPGRNEADAVTLLTAISAAGDKGSFFRTTTQLHNAEAAPVSGVLLFYPAAGAGAPVSLPYTLSAGETRAYPDLLPAMGLSGTGSVDVVPSSGPAPYVTARVFNDAGAAGTAGFAFEAQGHFDALQGGQRGTLLSPPSFSTQRFNVGVRTLAAGAHVTIRLRRSNGGLIVQLTRDYPANYFEQASASAFVGGQTLTGGESIEVIVDQGSLHVYGASADNKTNDPSFQLPQRATF